MCIYGWFGLAIALFGLVIAIWAHIKIDRINTRISDTDQMIQNMQTLSTSGGQSPILMSSASFSYSYFAPEPDIQHSPTDTTSLQ